MHPKFEHYLLKPLLDSTVSLDASSDENDDMEEAVALSEASTQTPTVKASAHRQSSWGRKLLIFVLSALTVLSFVAVRIALPLYAGSANKAGGDDFTVLLYASMWHPVVMTTVTVVTKTFCDRSIALLPAVAWKVLILIGFLSTLNGTCFAFAADRTPPHIQALLLAARIPFTVVARMILLRKGISVRRFACTVAVIFGMFVSVEPQITGQTGSGGETGSATNGRTGSLLERVVWPAVFCLAYVPASFECVIFERELRRENQALSIFTWSQVFRLVTVLPLFWIDFVPVLGMAKSFEDFGQRLFRGISCGFSSHPDCHGLPFRSWLFIVTYNLAATFQFLLIQHTEGAIYTAVVETLVMPLTTIFWMLFRYDAAEDLFSWGPEFTYGTVFTIVGLLIIGPAVALYSVFSEREKEKESGIADHRAGCGSVQRLQREREGEREWGEFETKMERSRSNNFEKVERD